MSESTPYVDYADPEFIAILAKIAGVDLATMREALEKHGHLPKTPPKENGPRLSNGSRRTEPREQNETNMQSIALETEPGHTPSPQITLLPTKFVPSPEGESFPRRRENASGMSLDAALTKQWPTDAHMAAYEPVVIEGITIRLASGALSEGIVVRVTALVFDVDDPVAHDQKTAARLEWREAERAKQARLAEIAPGFVSYDSKRGYRLIWRLEGVEFTSPDDAELWKDFYTGAVAWLEEHAGIKADPQCKDWTRLYRLPNVVRDGKPVRSAIEGSLGEPWDHDRTIEPAKPARVRDRTIKLAEPKGGAPSELVNELADAIEAVWSDHNHNGWRFPFLGWLAGKGWSHADRTALLEVLAERDGTSASYTRSYNDQNRRAKPLDGPGDIVKETLGDDFDAVDEIVQKHPSLPHNRHAARLAVSTAKAEARAPASINVTPRAGKRKRKVSAWVRRTLDKFCPEAKGGDR